MIKYTFKLMGQYVFRRIQSMTCHLHFIFHCLSCT